MQNQAVQDVLEHHLESAAKALEEEVDAELDRLDNLTEDDLDSIRQKRLDNMKKADQQKKEWLSQGHGEYSELPDEAALFQAFKVSKRIVVHFYRDSTFRCKIVDKHLALLAPQHPETRFCKLDAERSKFLVDRLKVHVLPTIALIVNDKVVDYIVGFDDLGGTDDFSTEMLEWRIAKAKAISYQGDLSAPPDQPSRSRTTILSGKTKTIRESNRGGGSDDDDDW